MPRASSARCVGSLLWDCFPGSEPLFKPYYDAARRSGAEVEFVQFYDGNVARIHAVPQSNGHLDLYWELLSHLDTMTLAGLVQTLDESLEVLDDEHVSARRSVLRQNLRLIEGAHEHPRLGEGVVETLFPTCPFSSRAWGTSRFPTPLHAHSATKAAL